MGGFLWPLSISPRHSVFFQQFPVSLKATKAGNIYFKKSGSANFPAGNQMLIQVLFYKFLLRSRPFR